MKEEQEKERSMEKKELEDLKRDMEEVRKMSEPEGDQTQKGREEIQSPMISSQEIRVDREDDVVEITEENMYWRGYSPRTT